MEKLGWQVLFRSVELSCIMFDETIWREKDQCMFENTESTGTQLLAKFTSSLFDSAHF